jgi:hypothetical protein
MQVVDANGNVFGQGLEITGIDGKPKVPVINTDITIGVTSIVSGTVGRVLFEGAGNVVQESANLFWDNINGRLDVTGTARITTELSVGTLGTDGYVYLNRASTGGNVGGIRAQASGSEIGGGGFLDRILCSNGAGLHFHTWTGSGSGSNTRMRIFGTSGNILIQNGGTFIDAGFRLDVTGTTRLNGNITGVGTLGITIPSVNSFANGSITAVPSSWGRPFAVDFTIGAYTLTTMDSQIHFGSRFSGVFFNGSQMYTVGIPTQIWGGPTGPNNCSSLHIGVNSTGEYQTGTNYPSTADNFFYLSTVMVAPNGAIYSPPRATPTRRSFILSALEVIFQSGNTGVERGRIFSSGNWGINTTTDAGWRLDVNGIAMIRGTLELQSTSGIRLRASSGAVATSFRPNGTDAEIRTNDASVASVYFNQNGIVGFSQQAAFGNTTASAVSAQVQVDSTTRGFLPPRMTNTQMLAIATPAAGLIVYDTTNNKHYGYDGTTWNPFY